MGSLRTLHNSNVLDWSDDFIIPILEDLSDYQKERIELEIDQVGRYSSFFHNSYLVPILCVYGFSRGYRVMITSNYVYKLGWLIVVTLKKS
jgi:hypothetical protein